MPNPNFIVLKDQLDEVWDNDFYCADVAGDVVTAGVPLQAHTCKEPNNDELFETNSPEKGMIWVSDHRMCLELTTVGKGGLMAVEVADCDPTNDMQKWQSTADGTIRPYTNNKLCWVVGEDPGIEHGGGGDHLNKTFSVDTCASHSLANMQFNMGHGFVGDPP